MILLFDTNIESIFHICKIYNKKNTIFNFNIKFMELENDKYEDFVEYLKKGGISSNWIQKAVNPKHKGFCTPITKPTCTKRRKALALRFKAMAKARKHENGGMIQLLEPLAEILQSGGRLSKEYIEKAREKPGGSNADHETQGAIR